MLVHVAIIALLILVSFAVPRQDEETGGVPVMMGDVDAAYGNYDPSTMVDVEVMPEEVPAPQPYPKWKPNRNDYADRRNGCYKPKKVEPKKEASRRSLKNSRRKGCRS